MDLSSSSTQRSTTSEALSIQPGSVRVTTAVAANEFARHLAENARSDAGRRRDERAPERAERAPERPREARDGKTENRKAGDERETPKDDAARPQAAEATSALPLLEDAMTAVKAVEAVTFDAATQEAAVATVTQTNPDATATETLPAVVGEVPVSIVAEEAAPEAEHAAAAKPDAHIANQAAQASDETGKSMPGASNVTKAAAHSAAAEAAPKETKPAGETATEKTRSRTDANRPMEITATDSDADAAMPEAKPAGDNKPAKGLGQEAAEQLAGKKADAKQTGELPKAALQAVQQMAQQILRAAAPQAQGAPLMPASLEANGTGRTLDMPASGLPQSPQSNSATATMRIGTLPGQSQPTQVPTAAIALQMARNLQKGISRFDIRLDPPEMGRIDVRMEIRKDGQVVAHMSVERPETLDLLQRDARALQQALNNAGLQADSDSLNFSLKDGQDDASNPSFAEGGDAAGDTDGEDEAQILPVYNVNLAADGGVDIRV